MVKRADSDIWFVAVVHGWSQPSRYCARILLSVLRTLVHGAFPWLQPRSPVVHVVVESAPDRPGAVAVVLESVRAAEAPVARAALRAHVVDASRHRVVAAVAHASPPANRAVARPAGRVAGGRAVAARVAVARVALARAVAAKEAVARVVAPSHRWLVSNAWRPE